MELTEIAGVDDELAEQLRDAGLDTSKEIQLASDDALDEVVGVSVREQIRDQLGQMHLDEEGRRDYETTLDIGQESDLDNVEVEIPGPDDNPLSSGGEDETVTFRVERSGEGDPFQDYELEVPPGATVLEMLHEIKDNHDATLTFRRSCGQGICGICAVRINGIPMLVCNTRVDEVAEGEDHVTITPLHNLPQIRDLVSDKRPFWEEVERLEPWLKRDPDEPLEDDRESIMYPEDLPDVLQMADCINCAVCFSDCDARRNDEEFLGPMASAKLYRFVADPRDAATDERLEMADESNIWSCMYAYQCAWCPKDVEPQEAINTLRKRVMARRGYENRAENHVRAFVESAKRYGRLDERTLPMKTKGIVDFLKEDAPKAMIWSMTFKMPPPIHHGVKSKREVRELMESIPHPNKYGEREDVIAEEGEW